MVIYRKSLIMFRATALRQKREREQREKAARGLEPRVFPYIKPFGQKFDKNQLTYFKYRHAFRNMDILQVGLLKPFQLYLGTTSTYRKQTRGFSKCPVLADLKNVLIFIPSY